MIIIFVILIILLIALLQNKYIKSNYDNNYYKIQNRENNQSLDYLIKLRKIIRYLTLNLNTNNIIYRKYKKGFEKLLRISNTIKISEVELNVNNTTSYTINKGEEIVMCIRNKNNFSPLNEIIYVLIHELSHIICPDLGHTENFYKINIFLLKEAIRLKLYINKNYNENPKEYCGIELNENLL